MLDPRGLHQHLNERGREERMVDSLLRDQSRMSCGAASLRIAERAPLAIAISAMLTPATWKNGIAASTVSPGS